MRRAADYLSAARRFADVVLVDARPEGSPLFADSFGTDARAARYGRLDPNAPVTALSNFAEQRHLIGLLVGLTSVTGETRYEAAARDAAALLVRQFVDGAGLIAWGGHVAVALPCLDVAFERDKGCVHELKCHYPDYAFLWSVDAAATRRFIEGFWNAHVRDWSRLDFDRHGAYLLPRGAVWQSSYAGTPVFFWGKGKTFVNTGSDLYYAAGMLAHLSGDSAPLTWATRLASRYVETRQPAVGLSGYQFSQCADSWCDGPGIRGDRAEYFYGPLVPDGHRVYESTLFRPCPVVQRCQLALASELGDAGAVFATWAVEELLA